MTDTILSSASHEVALGFDFHYRRVRRFTIPRRRHIVAAGEHQPVEPFESVGDRLRVIEDPNLPD